MALPKSILYFSRGRGHGHAVPDAALLKCLARKRPELRTTVASYSTGARTLAQLGLEVVDLGLPEDNEFIATFVAARQLIRRIEPDMVVAHEEFAALSAAAECDVESILISDWLPAAGTVMAEALQYAASVLIKEHPGMFPEPKSLRVRPIYSGPVCRRVEFDISGRQKYREELGLPLEGPLVTVVAGGWATEARAPLSGTVMAAFDMLPDPRKQLVWISQKDYPQIASRFERRDRCKAFRFITPIERLLAASDVVVTKATRCTLLDVARVGVPSISISHGLNPIDEVYCPRIAGNIALNAKAVTPEILQYHLLRCLRKPRRLPLNDVIEDDELADILIGQMTKLDPGNRSGGPSGLTASMPKTA